MHHYQIYIKSKAIWPHSTITLVRYWLLYEANLNFYFLFQDHDTGLRKTRENMFFKPQKQSSNVSRSLSFFSLSLFFLCLPPSHSLSLCLSLSVSLFLCVCVCLSLFLSFFLSFSLCLCLCLCLCLSLSLSFFYYAFWTQAIILRKVVRRPADKTFTKKNFNFK